MWTRCITQQRCVLLFHMWYLREGATGERVCVCWWRWGRESAVHLQPALNLFGSPIRLALHFDRP